MTADNWKPSEAIKKAFNKALDDSGCNWIPAGLKAVRPLIIAEEDERRAKELSPLGRKP